MIDSVLWILSPTRLSSCSTRRIKCSTALSKLSMRCNFPSSVDTTTSNTFNNCCSLFSNKQTKQKEEEKRNVQKLEDMSKKGKAVLMNKLIIIHFNGTVTMDCNEYHICITPFLFCVWFLFLLNFVHFHIKRIFKQNHRILSERRSPTEEHPAERFIEKPLFYLDQKKCAIDPWTLDNDEQ